MEVLKFPLFLVALMAIAMTTIEPPELRQMRKICAERGEKAEMRQNAITTSLIPYPFANFHYACSGDPLPNYKD